MRYRGIRNRNIPNLELTDLTGESMLRPRPQPPDEPPYDDDDDDGSPDSEEDYEDDILSDDDFGGHRLERWTGGR